LGFKLPAKGLMRWALCPNLDNAQTLCRSCCHGNRAFLVSCERCSHPRRCNKVEVSYSTQAFRSGGASRISLEMSLGAERRVRMVEHGAGQIYPYIDPRKCQHPTALQAHKQASLLAVGARGSWFGSKDPSKRQPESTSGLPQVNSHSGAEIPGPHNCTQLATSL
jgi:hypothetical protein